MVAHSRASVIGLRLPEAKGATVRGTRATDSSLYITSQCVDGGLPGGHVPFESPVVAPVSWRRRRYWGWIIR